MTASQPQLALVEPGEFPLFFSEIHHHTHCPDGSTTAICENCRKRKPFPWQSAYLDAVATGADWPDLDVPTALGKTTIISIWLYLLAAEYTRNHQHDRATAHARRTVPLRLVLAVDRRLVGDQAHRQASDLAAALHGAPAGSVRAKVAAALRDLSGGEEPLRVVRMRGGTRWDSDWAPHPVQPVVVTSTVDQIGSRLLFRGYQVSPLRAPIDAALIGTDTLLALDEAHLSEALLATTGDCAAYQRTATCTELAQRALRVVSLSATAATGTRARHTISEADRADPIAKRRIEAQRHVTLLDASTWSDKQSKPTKPAEAFAKAAELSVDALLPGLQLPAIAVIANTIAHARAAHTALAERTDIDVLLLIGRSRGAERDLLLGGPLAELLAGIDPDRARPLVVVATQTLEVGIDATFGAMVSECADWAAVLQRLGRLDRYGDLDTAPAILVRTHNPADPDKIPVYGPAAEHTWQWLSRHTLVHTTTEPAELAQHLATGLLLNPNTLPGLLADADTTAMTRTGDHIPPLHRVRVDAFARTSPIPVPDELPAPFLHGLDTGDPEVQVLWRADLPDTTDAEHAADRIRRTPVHPGETVTLPLAAVRRFLTDPRQTPDTSDLEGAQADTIDESRTARKRLRVPVLQRAGDGTWTLPRLADDLTPGATLVLPAAAGGHDAHGFTPHHTDPVPDLGDHPTDLDHADRTPLRLDPAVLATTTGQLPEQFTGPIKEALTHLAADRDDPDIPTTTQIIHTLIDSLTSALPTTTDPAGPARHTPLLRRRLERLRQTEDWRTDIEVGTDRAGLALAGGPSRLILIPARPTHDLLGAGDDDPDTSSLTRRVSLATHHQAVATRALQYAQRIGLPGDLARAVELAAHAHDCGKQHLRFQCMLCASDMLLAESLPEPLAKSGMDPNDRAARRQAARLASWTKDLRHEALSAAAVQAWLATDPPTARGLDHDLITHLVAAHHGHARPLLPAHPDPDPVTVDCDMPDGATITVSSTAIGTDWTGPDRFHTLNHRYGFWGLALLETLVRLADITCSKEGS